LRKNCIAPNFEGTSKRILPGGHITLVVRPSILSVGYNYDSTSIRRCSITVRCGSIDNRLRFNVERQSNSRQIEVES